MAPWVTTGPASARELARVAFETDRPGQLSITVDGDTIAIYYYKDPDIPRPYFAHVRGPNGTPLTRSHPPVEGKDLTDHPGFHPGIWLAFGDLKGSDSWRLKAGVQHARFEEGPVGGPGRGSFAVRNQYLDQQDRSQVICEETCCYQIHIRPAGYLLIWDSTFFSDQAFYFGDQEEMGLGLRVATALRAERKARGSIPGGTGTILDAEGRKNGSEVGGQSSNWCDYHGLDQGRIVGMMLMCHPDNFRPSWFHARDYGLLVANPFGRAAFDHGPASRVVVPSGKRFRLRYGILLHTCPAAEPVDLNAAYTDFLRVATGSAP